MENQLKILVQDIHDMETKDRTRMSLVDYLKPMSNLYNYCMANNLSFDEIVNKYVEKQLPGGNLE